MANETKAGAGQVNRVLLLVVGLLIGFIGGYAIGHQGAPSGAGALDAITAAADCPHELDPADRDILAGFICPATQCSDALLHCHCEIAHQIKDRVKQLLAEGKSPEEVRAEVKTKDDL